MRTEPAQLLADDFAFLEGPRWYRDHLWASDITDRKLYRIPQDGRREVVCNVPHRPSGIGFLPDGTPVVASMVDRKLMRVVDGKRVLRADLSLLAAADINDLVADERGRIYVGNFGYDFFGGAEKKPADLIVAELDVGVITDRISFDGKRAVACQLGGADGRTLFCCTFDGPPEDLVSGKRLAAIYTVRVTIPGDGCNVA